MACNLTSDVRQESVNRIVDFKYGAREVPLGELRECLCTHICNRRS